MVDRAAAARATVRAAVRSAVGLRAARLTATELDRLVARFLAAGQRAVRPAADTQRNAARRIVEAREALTQARRRLSILSSADDEPLIATSGWQRHQQLVQHHRDRLIRYEGVIGFGPSIKRVTGEETGEPCVLVLVEKKLSRSALRAEHKRPIPRELVDPDSGRRLPTDVVEVGYLRRLAFVGASIGPAGNARKGTIGAFARDRNTGDSVALTAMHVTGLSTPVPGQPLAFTSPSQLDDPNAAAFGRLVDGTMSGVDAAKVSVIPPATAVSVIPSFGPLLGSRPLVFPGDRGAMVRMAGATSRLQSGFIVEPGVAAPAWGLDSALLVDIPSADGDSGAVVFDSAGLALGLLAGEASWLGRPIRVFSPMTLVLRRLNCDLI